MPIGAWYRRFALLLWRDRATQDLEDELRLHRDLRAQSLRTDDIGESRAAIAARRQFGHPLHIQEASRDMWGFGSFDDLRQDIRHAARRLRQRPGFTAAVVGVLALGIGATTAMFSAVDAAMLRPLPFARPQELVTLPLVNIPFDPGPGQPHASRANHITDINDVTSMRSVFAHVAGWASGGLNLSDPQQPLRLNAGVVTADFFNTLGVLPAIGRGFAPEEGKPGNTHVVVLSYELWQRQFGGRAMLQQSILLNGKAYQVVGIMPRGFSFPKRSDLWIPMSVPVTFETFEPFRGWLPSEVIARVAPGVPVATAATQLLARWRLGLTRDSAAEHDTNLSETVRDVQRLHAAIPLQQSLSGDRTPLFVLLGATALLLLIACANVTNLLLSQAISRRREMAVREVLGATRLRVMRQLLTESTLLALAGALLGLAIAPLSLGLLRTLLPAGLTGVAPAEIDLRVLAFATLLALLTGITFGLWPALRTTSHHLGETIKSGGGHGSSAAGTGRGRRVLVAVELALTLVLLIGATLMLRSFRELMRLDGGLRSAQAGTLEMSFPASVTGYTARLNFVRALLDRLATAPGIATAGVVNTLPLSNGGGILLSITPDGMPAVKDDDRPGPLQLYASAGYFRAVGIAIIAGRTFTPADDSLAPPVAVINETMAKLYWPGVNALGRTFHLGHDVVTVVGLARDVRESRLEAEALPQMYLSIYNVVPATIGLVARGAMPPPRLLAAMQAAVHGVDPSQAVYHVRTMAEVTSASIAPRRTNTLLISLFATLALLLASLGVYAVVSHGVSLRACEFGIRSALGAQVNDLIALVCSELVWVVGAGIASGLAGAWMLVRVAASLLYGIAIHDTVTFVAVPLLLVIIAAIATLVPALRTRHTNVASVLRAD